MTIKANGMMRVSVWLIPALFLGARAGFATSLDSSVDSYVRDMMVQRHIPGLALAIIQQGHVERVASYGQASVEFSVPVAPSTLFNIASVTKSFSAVAVMKLVESGKVKLDEPIAKYLSLLPDSWKVVTIRQLLSHTSGLPDIVRPGNPDPIANTPEDVLAMLRSQPMNFSPGTQYRYDQTEYLLLGLLIEKISGMSYVIYCKTQLFAPAGLKDAEFGDTQTLIRNRGPIYTPFSFDAKGLPISGDLKILKFKSPAMNFPNNGLNISAKELARWLVALMNYTIIDEGSLETLWSPLRFNDGTLSKIPASPYYPWTGEGVGGVLVAPDTQHPAVGGTGGPYAAYIIYPKDRLAVVVLTNTQESNPDSLVGDIARKYLAASSRAN